MFTVPVVITGYLKKRMKRCLMKDECEALIKDHLKPDSQLCKVTVIDKFIKEFPSKRFPKEEDGRASKDPSSNLNTSLPTSICMEFIIREWVRQRPRYASPSIRCDINNATYQIPHW